MKTAKRILTVVLVLVLALTALPLTAGAASIADTSKSIKNGEKVTAIVYNKDNKNVQDYKLDAGIGGELTIDVTAYADNCRIYVYDKNGEVIKPSSITNEIGDAYTLSYWAWTPFYNNDQMDKYQGKLVYPVKGGTVYIRVERFIAYTYNDSEKVVFTAKVKEPKSVSAESGKKYSFTLEFDKLRADGTSADYGTPRMYKVEMAKKGTLKVDMTSAVSSVNVQVLDSSATDMIEYTKGTAAVGSVEYTNNYGAWIQAKDGKSDVSLEYKLDKGVYYVKVFGTIDAYVGGKTELTLTYPQAAKGAEITSFTITLSKGDKLQLGTLLNGKGTVKWSTSKKSVAAVSSKGKITAKAKGSATITAKCGTSTMKIRIIVK